jgi:excisionase family DNA binding protein
LEKLLNVKEAAEFLNVSEMTVRRWTNDGLLKCYRVGGRRARRFKQEDLLAYLKGNVASDVSLGIQGYTVPDGSHVTHLSLNPEESLDVAVSFVIEGLVNNETVCVVSPDVLKEKDHRNIETANIDADALKKAGRLHFSHGMDTPLEQARQIADVAGSSQNRFRIFGDMTWAKDKGWRMNDLHELEKIGQHVADQGDAVSLSIQAGSIFRRRGHDGPRKSQPSSL